jgi:DNA (cytosine-5)-methyltransferase 1
MIRYATVCDGIGAAVVDHRYGFRNLGDMTRFREWPESVLADVDVLVGGTPCQSFSVAGKRRGLDDERGNLALALVDLYSLINEVRKNHGRPPAILLWENVPGVLNTKDNAFGCLLAGLLGLDEALETQKGKWPKAGFFRSETVRVGYRVLDAQHFALAQRRRRVFLLAVPCELVERFGEGACPSQILSLPESLCRNTQAGRAGGKRAARCAGDDLAGDGGQGQSDYGCIAFHHNAQGSQLPSRKRDTGIADCLTASQRAAVAFTNSKRAWSVDDFKPWIPGEVNPTLTCVDHRQSPWTTVVVNDVGGRGQNRKTKVWKDDGTSYTLTTAMNQGVLVPPTIRRLTPVECERLMGYPDGYTAITYRDKPAADSPRYRALGNSMAVPIVRWICERIQKAVNAPGKD